MTDETSVTQSAPANLTIRVATSLSDVDAVAWDRLALASHPGDPAQEPDNPFVSHAFLSALEDSGSATAKTGWQPVHLLVEDEAGDLQAAMPLYLKSHSQGEYVFDHAWADAYQRAGGRYYPKLQACVPFTPATGPRLLMASDMDRIAMIKRLVQGAQALRDKTHASSLHVTFLPQSDWQALAGENFLQRIDLQYHWFNAGYGCFEDFLDDLASRKRKAIRRERREALSGGIEIIPLSGSDLTEAVWDRFFDFYRDTGGRKWGRPYLTRPFFSLIGEKMADRIVLMMARRAGQWIAGAINFKGKETLYGRHWGCVEEHPFLHFETCYYQAMDYAIAHGLKRVEAGAQGEHKLARGYKAVETYSAHDLADPALQRAVADYLKGERAHLRMVREEMGAMLPFRTRAD
jgi:uncharacterized protein